MIKAIAHAFDISKLFFLANPNSFSRLSWFALFMGGVISVWLGADINWDLTNYHLYNPFALFNGKVGVDLAPAGMQSYFNPLIDIPYYWLVQHVPAVCVGFLMGTLHAGNFILVALIARLLLPQISTEYQSKWAVWLALFGCLTANFSAAFGNTMGDITTALLVLSGLLIILNAVSSTEIHPKHLLKSALLAGFLVGLATGFKLTNAVFAVGLYVSFLVLPLTLRARIYAACIFGIAVLLGLALTAGYWFYEMWTQFGNPLFPQFSAFFPNDLTRNLAVADTAWRPKNSIETLLWPFILSFNPSRVGELKHHQIIWAIFYLVIICWMLNLVIQAIKQKRSLPLSPAQKYLIAFVLIAFVVWMKLFSIQRYLVAIEILVPLALFIVLHRFLPYERASQCAKFLLIIATATVYLGGAKNWDHADWAWDMFRIDLPTLNRPETTTVIMADGNPPFGWVAAQFPASVTFAQIEGNFPANIPAYSQRIQQMVDERGGEAFALFQAETESSRYQSVAKANAFFTWFNFTTTSNGCQFLKGLIPQLKMQKKVRLDFSAENQCNLVALFIDVANTNQTSAAYAALAKQQLAIYGFVLDDNRCQTYHAYIGQKAYPYQWCPIRKSP